MTRRLLHIVLIGSMMLPAAVATSDADTRWQRVAPEGAGFSVEVTGKPDPKSVPGDYQYQAGLWFLVVKVGPVEPVLRQLLERRDRKDARNCLERIRDTVLEGIQGKRHDSSFAEIQGYPAIRFSFEFSADGVEFAGTNLLVLTQERFYTVMAVGPKGLPDTDAQRFVRSFRLVATGSAAPESAASTVRSASPLVLKLAPQMLAVARLIIDDRMNPQLHEVVQKAPPAEHLGARWNPSTAAWQQARQSFTGRVERMVKLYENLCLVDESEAIRREIASAIASVKLGI
jgi:hypothetical protein